MVTTEYVYDDPEHRDRVTRTIQSPSYTAEDRALLVGLDLYERDLCRCGWPRSIAWHSEMDGFFEPGDRYVCHACTASAPADANGTRRPVTYGGVRNTRDPAKGPMPPFVLGITTTPE